MAKIILDSDAPQRSDKWHELHIGRPTASEFSKVITPAKMDLSKQRFDYAYRLAAERLLNQSFSKSLDGLRWIEEGKTQEPKAVQQYEALEEVETFRVSMILTDDMRFGCSPDRLVVTDDRWGVEIKSVFPPKLIRYHIEGSGPDHRIQVLGQFWVGELERNDLYCYNEAMPPFANRWERSGVAAEIAKVADHMDRFGDELDEIVEKMRATGFFAPMAKPTTTLDFMVEAMVDEIMLRDNADDLDAWLNSNVTALNMVHMEQEQKDRILSMAAHKRATLAQAARERTVHGWGADNLADRIVETGNWGG